MALWLAFLGLLFASPVLTQQTAPSASATSSQPTVRFSLDWSQGRPWTKFSISVYPDGAAHFQGTPSVEDGGDSGQFQQDFTMSEVNRQKVFELAAKLHYFNGDFDSHLKHIAQTGTKTLEYKSAEAQGSTSYNWSQNADVQQLTHLFWSISTTLDYGRKLAFQYRFDKLGIDSQLKQLVDLQAEHNVEEFEPLNRSCARSPLIRP